ncbi:MAG: fimbrillin family protein [Alistipes sp.]|nr:fimbrillin family protein [Alistipes sp.]
MFGSFVLDSLMKKSLMSIIAVATMLNLCSCSKEIIDEPNSQKAIVFNDVQTRGLVESADEILRMGVFAQMNLGDDTKQEPEPGSNSFIMLLENEDVKRGNPDTDWTYDNTRYWVADRAFHFFAVWPYSGENSSVTNVKSIAPVAGEGAYGYSVTFETPEAADQELLTATRTKTTREPFPESVGFNFQHELSNVNLKIWSNGAPDNVQDKIKVKEVSIKNVAKKGTLTTTVDGSSSWSLSSDKMSFTKKYDGKGIEVSQAQIINGQLVPNEVSDNNPSKDNPGVPFNNEDQEGLLLIPHTIPNGGSVIVTVIYDLQRPIDQEGDSWEEKKLQVFLPEGTWPAGKKLTYNLIISGERTITEFEINTVVEDWIPHTEEIDFTEQVEVREYEWMQWDETTCENVNDKKGEVVLFTDVNKVAECKFKIRTPIGATWTASLIPLTASAMDAFSIVEGSKYGDVGDDWQYVRIKINNPDPISARNECLLRITVQTSDGRTIVVKNLMPTTTEKGIEEYTIIQNLING